MRQCARDARGRALGLACGASRADTRRVEASRRVPRKVDAVASQHADRVGALGLGRVRGVKLQVELPSARRVAEEHVARRRLTRRRGPGSEGVEGRSPVRT